MSEMTIRGHRKVIASLAVAVLTVPVVIFGATRLGETSAAPQCNKYAKTISEAICMQDMNDSVKESMTTGQQYQLKDQRDSKMYYVSKLADDNVWMTQNLDLDLDSSVTYTSADTDLPANTTWKPERSTYTANQTEWGLYDEDENEYYGYVRPESYDPGAYYWNGELPQAGGGTIKSNSDSINLVSDSSFVVDSSNNTHYHIGNYYNWTAAVAMNDTTELFNSSASNEERSTRSLNVSDVNQSICPAGWTLPSDSSENTQFRDLMEEYGFDYPIMYESKTIMDAPIYFIPTGQWMGELSGGSSGIGMGGPYWSNIFMTGDNTGPAIFSFNLVSNYFDEITMDSILGFPIRCIARSRVATDAEEIEDTDVTWTENQNYELGSDEEAVVRIDAPLDELISVSVDDVLLTEGTEYTLTSGSTIVTFAPAYLNTLSEGEHQVEMAYQGNRTVATKLTVSKAPATDEEGDIAVPNTGANYIKEAPSAKFDTIATFALAGIIASIMSIVGLIKRNRR